MRNPLWHDETEFIQNGTQGIHQFRALVHQTLPGPEKNATRLLRFSAWFDKAHFRLTGRNDDRFRISSIVLLALHERLHILRSDQSDLVTSSCQFASPVMRAPARFKNDQSRRLRGHELHKLLTTQLFAKHHLARTRSSMNLENVLCQINAYHCILHLPSFRAVVSSNDHSGTLRCRAGRTATTPSHILSEECYSLF
ncbi:hypothetical protein NBRC3299_2739 [Acetobacter pasteurianus NBRC 3299]|nr:hypothetical protein NBRC3299_2739 [Acetobacter pasteurianus NBRC 3299]